VTKRDHANRRRKLEVTDVDLVRSGLDDEYEILEELGRGGMGIVYRARERQLEREVAIKVLPFTLAFDRELVERFLREARTAAALEHTNIVPIYRVGRRGDVIFFVMKLLRGQSLSDRLRDFGRISAAETRQVLIETASALGYAHRRGVVHRDVKPDNLRHDEDGRCVVTDFGIARSAGSSRLTTTGMSVGTPKYMSPEQARAKEVDGRSDIYSLGIVAYECIAGHTPFDGGDALGILMKHIQQALPRPALNDEQDWALYTVIERMLAKHPQDRFRDADELIATLGGQQMVLTTGQQRRWSTSPAPISAQASNATTIAMPSRAFGGGTDEGPQPSAALDAAFDASIQLFKRQHPKLQAIAGGVRGVFGQIKPGWHRVTAAVRRSAVAAALPLRRSIGATVPHVRATVQRWKRRLAAAATWTKVKITARGSTVWIATAGVIAFGVLVVTAFHTTTRHQSRCPAGVAMDGRRPFGVLVDSIGGTRRGSELNVRYDVCGLAEGATFKTRLSLIRAENGRKLTSADKVSATFEDTAGGPALRRKRAVDLGALPAGSYRVAIVVIDDRGRRREKEIALQITER